MKINDIKDKIINKIKHKLKIKGVNNHKENIKKYKSIFGIKVEKIENFSLLTQLVLITIISLAISALSLLVLIPAILKPFYEENIYNYLKQPAKFIQSDNKKIEKDITYIIITNGGATITSSNFTEMFGNISINDIISLATEQEGNFKINSKTYYYAWGGNDKNKNLVLTDNTLIKEQEKEILSIIFPTMLITTVVTTMLLFAWSKYILNKINVLKKQAELMTKYERDENVENAPYFVIDDELNSLSKTMSETKEALKKKEEYKNLMFQNISHELKTPISVIKSYTEAVEDKVVTEKESIKVISEEINNLINQVNSILQISKIDYMKDDKELGDIDIVKIVKESVTVHKKIRKDIVFNVNVLNADKKIIYKGTIDMYKIIFDNILSNFIRYANSLITINISNEFIQFINDGENIQKDIIGDIFLPYVKGKKGQSGLGLSIVKRAIKSFGYNIKVQNLENGVMFEISK